MKFFTLPSRYSSGQDSLCSNSLLDIHISPSKCPDCLKLNWEEPSTAGFIPIRREDSEQTRCIKIMVTELQQFFYQVTSPGTCDPIVSRNSIKTKNITALETVVGTMNSLSHTLAAVMYKIKETTKTFFVTLKQSQRKGKHISSNRNGKAEHRLVRNHISVSYGEL